MTGDALKGLKDQVNIASALRDRGITRITSFHLQVTDNAYAGLHLGRQGGALAPPLTYCCPPLSYLSMSLHTQTYVPLPPDPHKTLFCPLLSHFLDEALICNFYQVVKDFA